MGKMGALVVYHKAFDPMSVTRHPTRTVKVGSVLVGSQHPIVVQSMTNTDTADALRTAIQVNDLHKAGSELVRITVNSEAAAQAVPEVKERLLKMGCDVPLVGDFHFNGHRLLSKYPEAGEALAKWRINPGNVGRGNKRDEQFSTLIELARDMNKVIRIGVNWGSLDQDLLAHFMDQNAAAGHPKSLDQIYRDVVIESALTSCKKATEIGLPTENIIVSCKMSRAPDLIAVYRELAKRSDYALHLGLTEAGMGSRGIVASSAALGVLLNEGIGDTIRISLTPQPGGDRTEEVRVGQEILQSLELRAFTPAVTACPGCGRTSSTYFQELANDIQSHLRDSMPIWKDQYPGVAEMKVAVMGCVVNGPGESKLADIGISLPGNGERPVAPVYIDGEKAITLKGDQIAEEFKSLVQEYVEKRYGQINA